MSTTCPPPGAVSYGDQLMLYNPQTGQWLGDSSVPTSSLPAVSAACGIKSNNGTARVVSTGSQLDAENFMIINAAGQTPAGPGPTFEDSVMLFNVGRNTKGSQFASCTPSNLTSNCPLVQYPEGFDEHPYCEDGTLNNYNSGYAPYYQLMFTPYNGQRTNAPLTALPVSYAGCTCPAGATCAPPPTVVINSAQGGAGDCFLLDSGNLDIITGGGCETQANAFQLYFAPGFGGTGISPSGGGGGGGIGPLPAGSCSLSVNFTTLFAIIAGAFLLSIIGVAVYAMATRGKAAPTKTAAPATKAAPPAAPPVKAAPS